MFISRHKLDLKLKMLQKAEEEVAEDERECR